MDLLLDVNIVVDICAPRKEYEEAARDAVALCSQNKGRLWIYSGSVQTLEMTLTRELKRRYEAAGIKAGNQVISRRARELLQDFCLDKNWLAALSGEGNVFSAADPEDEQLIRSLDRFPAESVRLLTRDRLLLDNYPEKTISPAEFCRTNGKNRQISFVDLPAQQDVVRPALEKNVHTVLHHGRYILGPEVKELEEKLAGFAGAKHCVSCSSGTDALLMALMALEVGPGDAVFTTPFTFVATADVIARLGATPVFVDIDPRTYNLDPDKLDQAIKAVQQNDPSLHPLPHTPGSMPHAPCQLNPKCIIPVDLYGLPCDYYAINAIADKYGLSVIQDAAQSFGAEDHGRLCPSLGDIGCTSFFPSKPLGGYGDGGALFTDDEDLAGRLRSIRVHGQGANKYDTVRLGLKGRMDTLQAAVVLPKLDIYARELELRRQAAQYYNELLGPCSSVLEPPFVPEGQKSAWALYTVLTRDSEQRSALQARLKEAGIPSVIYYAKPLHLQPVFEPLGYKKGDFPVAEASSDRVMSLPMHPYLEQEEMEKVVSVIRNNL